MSNIALSGGVRQNLLSLQQTARQQTDIQQKLATGKRVNSAIDNPVNFFTSGSLYDRATQLSNLLDGQSNAVQTVQAASKGIDAITKLVQAAQSTVKQAQNEAAQNRPTKAGTTLATTAEATATNKSRRDVALDKKLIDDNDVPAQGQNPAVPVSNDATATYSGNLGINGGSGASKALQLTIIAGDTTYSVTLGAGSSLRDVVNEINKSGIANASVDESGKLTVTGTGSDTLRIGLGVGSGADAAAAAAAAKANSTDAAANQNDKIGLALADVGTVTNNVLTGGIASPNVNSAVRSNLIQQFNDLRTQISQLAKDAGFNGTNLLDGNRLSVVFNEKTGQNQTKLDIQGAVINADNLGIGTAVNGTPNASAVGAGEFSIQNDNDLAKAATTLTGALSSLRSLASTFGSNLSVVQTRQDFTKSLIDTLKIGADNLVLADSNEEGANLLALNTRQQLSQTALSLANQADQGVLRLFG